MKLAAALEDILAADATDETLKRIQAVIESVPPKLRPDVEKLLEQDASKITPNLLHAVDPKVAKAYVDCLLHTVTKDEYDSIKTESRGFAEFKDNLNSINLDTIDPGTTGWAILDFVHYMGIVHHVPMTRYYH